MLLAKWKADWDKTKSGELKTKGGITQSKLYSWELGEVCIHQFGRSLYLPVSIKKKKYVCAY